MKAYTKEQWQWLWQRYCEGYSMRELGSLTQLHPESLRRRFQALGYLPRNRKDLTPIWKRYGEFLRLEDEVCA